MTLDLTSIRQPETPVATTSPPAAFGADEGFRLLEPARLTGVLHKDKDRYRLVGRFSARLEVPCSRCLEPYEVPADAAIDLRYLPRDLAGSPDEDADRDPSTTFYADDRIDLDELVREQCYLVLPMKPLCRDACQGLCPTCGANLNLERCDCQPRWADPRLAGLQALASPRTNDDA
jgi:uncharacterized protein